MDGDVDDVLRHADRSTIERKIAELRRERETLDREIKKRERFLALLDEWVSPDAWTAAPEASEPTSSVQVTVAPKASTTPGERRDAILSVLQRDPSREWTTDEIRGALNELGVSFEGGTPLKTLLFRMKDAGTIERPRLGVYKLPASGQENGQPAQEVMRT